MTKTILLAVTGSISAYKAADLSNQLKKLGYNIQVIMSQAASEFITPLTLQVLSKNPVYLDLMTEDQPGRINHIDLAKEADLFIVAPASANTIAKLAHGMADNLVTATALALPSDTPKLLALAMNTKMYDNPLTQRNLMTLKEVGYKEIEPRSGKLACRDVGQGALADLPTIIKTIEETLNESQK